jgi:hypothetical protein
MSKEEIDLLKQKIQDLEKELLNEKSTRKSHEANQATYS